MDSHLDNYIAIGVGASFLACLTQSISYVASRYYLAHTPEKQTSATISLFTFSHIWILFFAFIIIPLYIPAISPIKPIAQKINQFPPLSTFILPLFVNVCFYLLAQTSLFSMQQRTETSRIVPLLSVKLIFLAILSRVFLNEQITLLMIVAIVLVLIAASALAKIGGNIDKLSLLFLLGTALGYSVADMQIKLLMDIFAPVYGYTHASIFIALLSNGCAGILALVYHILTLKKRPPIKTITKALPFATLWTAAMVMLFASFGLIGPLMGSIVQSLRGVVAIAISSILLRFGFSFIENKGEKGVLTRRCVAGVLMVVAIICSVIAKSSL